MPAVPLSRFADPVITALTVLKATLGPNGWNRQDPMVQRAFLTLLRRGFPDPDMATLSGLTRQDFAEFGRISEILDDKFRTSRNHPGAGDFSANLSRAIVSHALRGAQGLKELFGQRDGTGRLVNADLRVPNFSELMNNRSDALLRGPTTPANASQPGVGQGTLANMQRGNYYVLGQDGADRVVVRCDGPNRYSLYREANGQWMRLMDDLSAPQMVAVQQMSEMDMSELGRMPSSAPAPAPASPTQGIVYDVLPAAPGAAPENIYESADTPIDPATRRPEPMAEAIYDAFCVM